MSSSASSVKCALCNDERQKLFIAISKFGIEKVQKDNPELLQKAKNEGWIARAIYVQNCKKNWVPITHKRKRPTREQFLQASKKRKKAMTKQLEVFQAKVDELKLAIELQEAAQQILKLKAKKKEVEAE